MYKVLRILFTILSALCVTAAFIIGAYFGLTWVFISALSALFFFMLMLLCKQKQEALDSAHKQEAPEEEPSDTENNENQE